jgi:exosortase D (VPLPA-CTERM-specific)
VIGVMVDARGIEAAEGFMHLFEGWVIFLLCIGMMILLARLMQLLTRDRRSLAETLDLDMTGIGTQLARVGDIRPSAALIGGTLVIGTVGALMIAAPQLGLAREPEPVDRTPFALFPDELDGWHSGPRKKLSERVERVLGADDYIVTDYRNPDHPAAVNLYVAWYLDQTDGGTHSPEICIPGGGWEIDDIERIDLDVAAPGGEVSMRLNRIVIRNGLQLQLAYYWYEQRGRRLASDFAAKGYLLWDSFRTGRSDGALVRLVTPVRPGESLDVAETRLNAFLATVMPELTGYIESDWPTAAAD